MLELLIFGNPFASDILLETLVCFEAWSVFLCFVLDYCHDIDDRALKGFLRICSDILESTATLRSALFFAYPLKSDLVWFGSG